MSTQQQVTVHGTFISLFGVGVHLTGKPGIGKSELALALIHRQHQLIADDAPVFTRKDHLLWGSNPLGRHFISIRGVGLFNVALLFGQASTRLAHPLHLIIHLHSAPPSHAFTHLMGHHTTKDILGCLIPHVTIPIITPRNLAIITETLVKNFLLTSHEKKYDPVKHVEALLNMERNPA